MPIPDRSTIAATLLVAALQLTGCTTTRVDITPVSNAWLGASYEEVVSRWGTPVRSTSFDDGRLIPEVPKTLGARCPPVKFAHSFPPSRNPYHVPRHYRSAQTRQCRKIMSDSLEHLRQWVGRKESHHDLATAWPIAAMAATLDRNDPPPRQGDAIPEGWHWSYFLEAALASELAHDGHPKRGGFLPPVTLPRRMWAGGRLEFKRPIKIGEQLSRESEILSVEPKSGNSGNLVFVTVRHTVSASNEIAVVEEHDIVYRDAAKPGAQNTPGAPTPPGKPAPATATWRHEVMPDEAMLFRYSALIFNAHRIHYDIDYCRKQEGYPGLIVHGPLQTTLLLDLSRRHAAKPVRKLDYRAVSPLFHNEKLTVGGNPSADGATAQLWTAGPSGNIAMTGTVIY